MMRTHTICKLAKTGTLVSFVALLGACSGSQQDAEGLQVDAEDAAEAPEDAYDSEEPNEGVEEPSLEDALPVDIPVPDEMMPATDAATSFPTEPAVGSVGMSQPASGYEQTRVVRFISAEGTNIFSEAKDGANAVGTLRQGDVVMVVEEGEWARISDSMFIRADKLSAKAVPRRRLNAVWTAPNK